jgi:hypothetical protein
MALKIGEILLQRGLISGEQLDRALAMQRRWGVRVGVCLVRLGFIEETSLAVLLSEQIDVPLASSAALEGIPPEVIGRVPQQVALKHRLVPFRIDGTEIQVCLADPQNLLRLDDIAFTLGCCIRPYLATETLLERALARYYQPDPISTLVSATEISESDAWDAALNASGEWRAERRELARRPAPAQFAAPTVAAPPETPASPASPTATESPATRQNRALLALRRSLDTVKNAEREPVAVVVAVTEPSAPAPAIDVPEQNGSVARAPVAEKSAFATLAAVTSHQDLVAALIGFLDDIFPTVCVLEVESNGARCVGFRAAGARHEIDCSSLPSIPFDRAGWIVEAMGRAPIKMVEQIADPALRSLLERLGMALRGVCVALVTDGSTFRYVLLGQGLVEVELKANLAKLRSYLQASSDAVRMLALRDLILSRERAEPTERAVSDQASTRHLDFSGASADPRLRSPR